MKLLLVEFLDLWERSPAWRNSIIAGLVGLIMVFFAQQSSQNTAPPGPAPPPGPVTPGPKPPPQPGPGPNPLPNPGPSTLVDPSKVRVKKIDPPVEPKEGDIPLDTSVGKPTPKSFPSPTVQTPSLSFPFSLIK